MQRMVQDVGRIVKGNTRRDGLETFKEEITFGRRGAGLVFRCRFWQHRNITDSSLLWVVNASLCNLAYLSLFH